MKKYARDSLWTKAKIWPIRNFKSNLGDLSSKRRRRSAKKCQCHEMRRFDLSSIGRRRTKTRNISTWCEGKEICILSLSSSSFKCTSSLTVDLRVGLFKVILISVNQISYSARSRRSIEVIKATIAVNWVWMENYPVVHKRINCFTVALPPLSSGLMSMILNCFQYC